MTVSGSVCEVGPGVVRVFTDSIDETHSLETALVESALDAGDDPLTLVNDRAVPIAQVWQRIFERLLGSDATGSTTLVHPSCWPPARVATVADAARQVVGVVHTRVRSDLHEASATVIEIGPQHVAVGIHGRQLHLESRWAAVDTVVDRVVQRAIGSAATVSIDAPDGVPGAAVLGRLIAERIRAAGHPVRVIDEHRLRAAAHQLTAEIPTPAPVHRPDRQRGNSGRLAPVALGAGGLATIAALVIVAPGVDHTNNETADPPTELVEGRVAVRVPVDWPVQRVTDGPGSARLQLVSPVDGQAVLHITQARVPTDVLGATADALREAMSTEPPGVFLQFTAADQREGRPAVTYREVRPGHDIEWNVLVDDGIRIGIGCQSAPDRVENIAEACAEAIRSARGLR